jgi:hypothetical protein
MLNIIIFFIPASTQSSPSLPPSIVSFPPPVTVDALK